MDKHRLALFSDGVYAIILTLLVLELKPPHAGGLAGLREVAPALVVHALSFMMVGTIWRAHFRVFLGKQTISDHVLKLNLLTLFCATLIPFGSLIAAERPTGSLGAAMLCLSLSGSVFVLLRIFTIEQPESLSQPTMQASARRPHIHGGLCVSVCRRSGAVLRLTLVRLYRGAGNLRLFTNAQPIHGPLTNGGWSVSRIGSGIF